jgi:hypothetical protein
MQKKNTLAHAAVSPPLHLFTYNNNSNSSSSSSNTFFGSRSSTIQVPQLDQCELPLDYVQCELPLDYVRCEFPWGMGTDQCGRPLDYVQLPRASRRTWCQAFSERCVRAQAACRWRLLCALLRWTRCSKEAGQARAIRPMVGAADGRG